MFVIEKCKHEMFSAHLRVTINQPSVTHVALVAWRSPVLPNEAKMSPMLRKLPYSFLNPVYLRFTQHSHSHVQYWDIWLRPNSDTKKSWEGRGIWGMWFRDRRGANQDNREVGPPPTAAARFVYKTPFNTQHVLSEWTLSVFSWLALYEGVLISGSLLKAAHPTE